jgi:hypothetical protein
MDYIFKLSVKGSDIALLELLRTSIHLDNYNELPKAEQEDLDLAWDWMTDNLSGIIESITPLVETSMVCWLPIGGTVPPALYTRYLFTDGVKTWTGEASSNFYFDDQGYLIKPTHYAELPVITVK